MSREIPPGAMAALDQYFAEADEKYGELVGVLRMLTENYGVYEAAALMSIALESARNETLASMVVTGLRREMLREMLREERGG